MVQMIGRVLAGSAVALTLALPREGAAADVHAWRDDVGAFAQRELAAHLAAVPDGAPLPERVYGALTTGEFSWGTFLRAMGAYAESTGDASPGGRELAPLIGRIGLRESAAGSKAFAQLYAGLALRSFGRDLEQNAVWQGLSDSERDLWRQLLDPARFYDRETGRPRNLPENYLGVAARTSSLAHEAGLSPDRSVLDALLDRSVRPFREGLYADDAPPTGRYDRYSNEYARYVWEAARDSGRRDLEDVLRPSLTAQMRLWWDLVAEDGYGYNWGRSLGVVSYLDTLEIAAFLARTPELRPAPLADIAAAARQAWLVLRRDYHDDRHLLGVFDEGRGSYAYITREREWQQTIGFLGKVEAARAPLFRVLEGEGVTAIPERVPQRDVARFEFFRQSSDGPCGVWIVRNDALHFALPIVSGPKTGVADYLPAPHGLPGFAAPVEQIYPALVPFVELEDGRTFVAAGPATRIEPRHGGSALRAVWAQWSNLSDPPGTSSDIGLESEVRWTVRGHTLTRRETLRASRSVRIRRWWMAVPSTDPANRTLAVAVKAPASWRVPRIERVPGTEALGRGARGAVPLHLLYEARELDLSARKSVRSEIELSVTSSP